MIKTCIWEQISQTILTRLKLTRFILFIGVLLALVCPMSAAQVVKTPVPGVTLSQDISADPALPQVVTVISVELANPTLNLQAVLGKDDICNSDPDKGR
ncbi:MAG: hypothetical protein NT018_01515, partial [Armatimonadetes bacterium]|nr:hypothetical protein [Armatimonadota bacterium]